MKVLVDPAFGAAVTALIHKPSGLHWLFEAKSNDERLQEPFIYGLVPLFPPGRIRGGRFVLGGREYIWPLNDHAGAANLHGVGFNRAWAVDQVQSDRVTLVLDAVRCPEFGARFRLALRYRLDDEGLGIEAELVNQDPVATIPAALGFHININLKDTDYACEWPNRVPWELDGQLIPTGQQGRERPRQWVRARTVVEDQPYQILAGTWEPLPMVAASKRVTAVLEASAQFRHLVIYRPTLDAPFLSVEPYSWVPDAPHLPLPEAASGFVSLPPGGQERWSLRLRFQDSGVR